jgi:hypothetical protein
MLEVVALRDAGKIREARRAMKKTDAVYTRLKSLKANMRALAATRLSE